jgi:Leucine-rich repeat (LRR) protein
VVAWSPNSATVEIQRISSDGGLMWGDGILIEDNIESLMSPQPTVDSNGNVIVQWIGQSGPIWAADSKIYLQKYDLDGNAQWDNPTVAVGPVVFPMGNWSQGIIADDTGGSFSAWTQFSGNVQNAVSQHITGEGAIAWTGGVDLSTNSSNFRMSPMLSVAEETQELMAVWREANGSQSQRGISAQRLDSSGNQLWGSNGVTVVALNSSYDYLDLSMAGFGEELISAYIQQSTNMNGDIYANRLDAEGNLVWTDETVTVTNTGTAKSDMMAGKGPNCLFIAWTENGSVYVHCLREDGTLGAPDVGSPDCTADDGTDGVELWGECYSIENTTELDLSNSGLTGSIPTVIGNLINLEYLNLRSNQLTGSIPPEIGNLINLEYLHLRSNQLTDSIPPEIGNLINLNTLILGYNQLTGEIPPEIGNLTSLDYLYLSTNQLTGELPSEIWILTNLEYLNLRVNQFTGEIPPEIGNLNNLTMLRLYDNQLTGELPSEIWTLTNLEVLTIDGNQLTGTISPEIGELTNLHTLWLSENTFTGSIPSELFTLPNLIKLYLFDNQLTGEIPSEIGNLTNLERLQLHTNQLTGSIPETLCDLSNLTWSLEQDSLYTVSTLFDNQLCPPYPSCIEDYVGYQDTTNCEQVSIIDETLPITYNLYNAYPNPFNPVTTLQYDLPEDAMVNITIYDMMGRQVKTMVNTQQNAGYKSIQWNATNNAGQSVSAGLYLYTIQAGDYNQTKKMVLLK